MAARASRTENQDAIDTAIVGMLADPKEVASFYLSRKFLSYTGLTILENIKTKTKIRF